MHLADTDDERQFRREVRAFVERLLPDHIRRSVLAFARLEKRDITLWHRILYDHGWGAPGWPIAFGGTGWTSPYRKIFDDETYRGGAPRLMPFVNMIGPILQRFGTSDQKSRFLPPMLRMEEWWCQGYSEPDAGSDLASLRTSAVVRGDRLVINGRKLWTSFARWSDWMFALVRTSTEGKRQAGITFVLIDMRSAGIEVRSIPTLNGDDDIAEVILDDVSVPVENVVGEINGGWSVAKHLLGHERTEVALVGHNKRLLDRVRSALRDAPLSPFQRESLRRTLATWEMRLLAQEMLLTEILSDLDRSPGYKISILKLQGVEIAQALSELLLETGGPQAIIASNRDPDSPQVQTTDPLPYWFGAAELYFDSRRHSIYGGTTEIQKNIVAKALLRF